MDHRIVLQQVVAWASHEDTIRAVVLTGSVARGDQSFDALSDLDLELYVTDPSALLEHDAWYHQFGEVLVVEALENPEWHPTRLIYYAEGKIDFMVASTSVLAHGVSYDRPFQVLIDKAHVPGAFRPEHEHQEPPTASEFLQCVHWFYAATIMWAKYLARGDPWAAKARDWDSKILFLRMLEWDQKTRKGWEYDTWHLGLHLREWVEPELLDCIDACWSGFSRQDSVQALLESLSLFDILSTRTAIALGMEPFDVTHVRRQLECLLGTMS